VPFPSLFRCSSTGHSSPGTAPPASKGVRVFISYSHGDKKWVRTLVHELVRRGYAVWFDKYDLAIPKGLFIPPDELATTLGSGIRSQDIYLLLKMTDLSVKSEWVLREVEMAFTAKQRVLTIL